MVEGAYFFTRHSHCFCEGWEANGDGNHFNCSLSMVLASAGCVCVYSLKQTLLLLPLLPKLESLRD